VDLVVDASIAFKWLVKEVDSDAALQLLRSNTIVAPDILLAECRNAILTTVRRGKLSVERAEQLERDFESMQIETMPSRMFLSNAFAIALEIGHPIYDCIYLAAAIAADRMLVTADEKFAMKVTAPVIGHGRVKLLRTFAAGT